jgi:hypothetical protein
MCWIWQTTAPNLARTTYIRYIYGIFWQGNHQKHCKNTVIYGVYIRFWPTLTRSHEFWWYGVLVINKLDLKRNEVEQWSGWWHSWTCEIFQNRVWVVRLSFNPCQFAHTLI